MEYAVQPSVTEYVVHHKRWKLWQKVVFFFAAVVVFCTTYALILPAITLTPDTFCGIEEHVHTDECYVKELICTEEAVEGVTDSEAVVVIPGHTHDESCYASEQAVICGLVECEGHTHDESCMQAERVLCCGLEESEEHAHDESCYTELFTPVCGLNETEGHTHNDDCYADRIVLICELEEGESYEAPAEAEAEAPAGHVHGEECYKKTLVCTKEVHEHELMCYSDPTADLETAAAWERNLPKEEQLTGNWGEDVIAVAKTQLGYRESERNYQVEDGVKKGYTRYGEWYGTPYGDWCAMFASFCIRYAGIDAEYMPIESSCRRWISSLGEMYHSAEDYIPKTGDVIFFEFDGDYISDHVGLVSELVLDEEGNLSQIKTIEGNYEDDVHACTYDADDERIMGYGELPVNPDPKPLLPMTGAEETAEETEDADKTEADAEKTEADAEKTEADAEKTEDVAKKDGEEAETTEELLTAVYEGPDYIVTVTYTAEANIPEDAVLIAEEYEKTSEVYLARYAEAAELYGWPEDADYTSEFRLFNIGFYVDGVEIEPEAEVKVTISYVTENSDITEYQVTHFHGDEIKTLENFLTRDEAGTEIIDFATGKFSDIGIMPLGLNLETTPVDYDLKDLVGYFSFDSNSRNGTTFYDNTHGVKAEAHGNYGLGWSTVAPDGSGGQSLNISNMGNNNFYKSWFSITKNDGSSLLKNYNEVCFDFWMYPMPRPNGDPAHGWPIFAASNGNNQSYNNEHYIAVYNENTSVVVAERFNTRNSAPSAVVDDSSVNMLNKWNHVRVEYTTTTTTLYVDTYEGNTIVSSQSATVNNNKNIADILNEGSVLQIGRANWPAGSSYEYFNGFIDELRIYARNTNGEDGYRHPDTSHTLNMRATGTQLFSVNTAHATAEPLAGVEYTVTDNATGQVYKYVTGDTYVTKLEDDVNGPLPPGNYTVEQTAVPEGYLVVPQTTTFTVKDEENNLTEAGIFFVYSVSDGYDSTKTAQQQDYNNRIYEVDLTSYSGNFNVKVERKNFNFVVDQSNSMLFPANLEPVGDVLLRLDNDSNSSTTEDASGNGGRIETLLNSHGLPLDQVYYMITEADTKATVYAIWKSTNGNWYYQDASSYAQARDGAIKSGTTTPYNYADVGHNNNTALVDSGGCLNGTNRGGNNGYALYYGFANDSNAGKWNNTNVNNRTFNTKEATYILYTGSYENRLTYLKFAIKQMLYELAAMGSENTVTISTFTYDVLECMTRDVNRNNLQGVNDLVEFVDGINTYGGTSQQLGLWHVTGDYAGETGHSQAHLEAENNFVIMITDGALNSGKDVKLIDRRSNSHEDDLRYVADKIRNSADGNTKLLTIGLSVQNVTLAQTLLSDNSRIGGIASPGMAYLDIDASELPYTLSNALLGELVQMEAVDQRVDVKDYISDSFYLITPSGVPLEEGDWIDLRGNKCAADALGKAGQVGKDENGWYILWEKQLLPAHSTATQPWAAKFFVKAKEDFIGGNSIDTNKGKATLDLLTEDRNDPGNYIKTGTVELDSPNVNVRLLEMNTVESEETVFLGDEVSVLEKVEALLNQLHINKIPGADPNGDDVHNARPVDAKDPSLTNTYFTLPYAADAFTDYFEKLSEPDKASVLTTLLSGAPVTVAQYTYDDDSSHGPVGEFRLSLVKNENGSYSDHAAAETGDDVETYTLRLEYVAYTINDYVGYDILDGETEKRPENVNNGSRGPGNEVGGQNIHGISNGYGIVTSDNTHKVNVVDGKLNVIKRIADDLIDKDNNQTFEFWLEVMVEPETDPDAAPTEPEFVDYVDADGQKVILPVTVLKNTNEGQNVLRNLPRGTYKLVERPSEDYSIEKMVVKYDENGTNCYINDDSETTEIIFTIGEDENGSDVITLIENPAFVNNKLVYSELASGVEVTDQNAQGISFETSIVLNKKFVLEKEIPVQKLWNQVPDSVSSGLDVYVGLYLNDEPVIVDGHIKAVLLNSANNWSAKFKVPVDNMEVDPSNLGYSVRELSGVTTTEKTNSALIINVEPEVVMYFDSAVTDGSVKIGDSYYRVSVSENNAEGEEYSFTVTNSQTYELPESGGIGTLGITVLGAVLTAFAMLGLCWKLRGERRST